MATARVTSISIAPVKGLGLRHLDEAMLEPTGVRENRRFYLIDDAGRLVNGKRVASFVQIHAEADPAGTHLTLHFPDGTMLGGEIDAGDPVETDFFGRPVSGALVNGDFSEALSAFARKDVRLVRADHPGAGSDRGAGASVSLVSKATLDRLAREVGEASIDGRRFRMLFGIDGVDTHEEESWLGRSIAMGAAVVRFEALVGRCAVTTQNPETGVVDIDTLRALAAYRADVVSEEPLPIGIWGRVEKPGPVRLGDSVQPQ